MEQAKGPYRILITGARVASTVDDVATCEAYARKQGWTIERHPADWNTHGRRAGMLRNQHMVDLGADVCLAFPKGESTGVHATACTPHRRPTSRHTSSSCEQQHERSTMPLAHILVLIGLATLAATVVISAVMTRIRDADHTNRHSGFYICTDVIALCLLGIGLAMPTN